MATLSDIVNSVKAHLEGGAQLLEEHMPALAEHAAQIESDPLVQAALATALSPEGKALVTDLMQRLEALEQARAAAAAAAAAQPEPAQG